MKCYGCGDVFANKSAYLNHARYTRLCTFEMRFWGRVDKNGPGGCWLWLGVTNERGYGMISYNGNKNFRAHRYTWEMVHGPTPSERFCLHKCDVRNCVNPAHMYLGSYKENSDDMYARGRDKSRGEKNSHAKLTEEQAKAIIRDFKFYSPRRTNAKELAELYGVDPQVVYMAGTGRAWMHLHPPEARRARPSPTCESQP